MFILIGLSLIYIIKYILYIIILVVGVIVAIYVILHVMSKYFKINLITKDDGYNFLRADKRFYKFDTYYEYDGRITTIKPTIQKSYTDFFELPDWFGPEKFFNEKARLRVYADQCYIKCDCRDEYFIHGKINIISDNQLEFLVGGMGLCRFDLINCRVR